MPEGSNGNPAAAPSPGVTQPIGGDVIVSIDGRKMTSQFDMNVALNRKRPGNAINVTFYRGRQKMEQKVTLGDR